MNYSQRGMLRIEIESEKTLESPVQIRSYRRRKPRMKELVDMSIAYATRQL